MKALEFYNEAIKLNPTELLFYSNTAACYIEMKKNDEAI